jgi:hypothetical protein
VATLIKNIRSRNIVEFDKGKFDNWCVYLTKTGEAKYAPTDIEYFSRLKELSNVHGEGKIYNDFIRYYQLTDKTINQNILSLITTIADEYNADAEEMDIWFTVIYAGMVAEENKEFAILKKRIKRLGMRQVLLENVLPRDAANFSKGKRWKTLDSLMKQKGF